MNFLFTSLFAFITYLPVSGDDFELPKTWTKDFRIDGYEGGGMRNDSESFLFTYDSSIFIERTGEAKKKIAFVLTAGQRAEILAKLEELKVGSIKTQPVSTLELDAPTSRLCFEIVESHCISETELPAKDRGNYFSAYAFLLQFAKQKGNIK